MVLGGVERNTLTVCKVVRTEGRSHRQVLATILVSDESAMSVVIYLNGFLSVMWDEFDIGSGFNEASSLVEADTISTNSQALITSTNFVLN